MTNPDCEELVKIAYEIEASHGLFTMHDDKPRQLGIRKSAVVIAALRRLASCDSGLKVRELEWSGDGMREALERSIRELEYNRANHYSPDITTINRLKDQVLVALTAPGATTKSDGGGESRPANPGTGGRAPCIEQTTPATMPAQAGVAPGPSDPSSTRSGVPDDRERDYARYGLREEDLP